MTLTKIDGPADFDDTAAASFEGEIREFVRRDVATNLGRQPEHESERVASNITSVLQRELVKHQVLVRMGESKLMN